MHGHCHSNRQCLSPVILLCSIHVGRASIVKLRLYWSLWRWNSTETFQCGTRYGGCPMIPVLWDSLCHCIHVFSVSCALLPRQSLTSASPKPHKNQTNPLMKHLSTSAPLNSAAVAMPEAVHGASVSQELSHWGGVQLLPATGFHMFHHRFRFADDRGPTPVHEWVVTFMSCGHTPCPSAE